MRVTHDPLGFVLVWRASADAEGPRYCGCRLRCPLFTRRNCFVPSPGEFVMGSKDGHADEHRCTACAYPRFSQQVLGHQGTVDPCAHPCLQLGEALDLIRPLQGVSRPVEAHLGRAAFLRRLTRVSEACLSLPTEAMGVCGQSRAAETSPAARSVACASPMSKEKRSRRTEAPNAWACTNARTFRLGA